jgi:hypothetical protein
MVTATCCDVTIPPPPGGSAWRLSPLTTLPWVAIIIIIIIIIIIPPPPERCEASALKSAVLV